MHTDASTTPDVASSDAIAIARLRFPYSGLSDALAFLIPSVVPLAGMLMYQGTSEAQAA